MDGISSKLSVKVESLLGALDKFSAALDLDDDGAGFLINGEGVNLFRLVFEVTSGVLLWLDLGLGVLKLSLKKTKFYAVIKLNKRKIYFIPYLALLNLLAAGDMLASLCKELLMWGVAHMLFLAASIALDFFARCFSLTFSANLKAMFSL